MSSIPPLHGTHYMIYAFAKYDFLIQLWLKRLITETSLDTGYFAVLSRIFLYVDFYTHTHYNTAHMLKRENTVCVLWKSEWGWNLQSQRYLCWTDNLITWVMMISLCVHWNDISHWHVDDITFPVRHVTMKLCIIHSPLNMRWLGYEEVGVQD